MKNFLDIIFEDEDILAVNKKSGIAVIPERVMENRPLNEEIAIYLGFPPLVVHRIDKTTSGIVLFAKNKKTHTALNKLFMERKIEKIYWAIVRGFFAYDYFQANYPLKEIGNKTIVSLEKGQEAITEFFVKEKFRDYTLIEARPHTGRQHQIRVHLSFMGTPILCDPLYGFKESVYLSSLKKKNWKHNKEEIEKPILDRTALHALQLRFRYKRKDFVLEAPLPKDMKATLHQLRKWNKSIKEFISVSTHCV